MVPGLSIVGTLHTKAVFIYERDGKPRGVYVVQTGCLALRITVVIADVI
jgi:hypothetical protein